MTDPLERLEAELAAMRPRPMPEELTRRIARSLGAARSKGTAATPGPWADRFLISAICTGALAACVIVTSLLAGSMGINSGVGPMTAAQSHRDIPKVGTGPLVFAHADRDWADLVK